MSDNKIKRPRGKRLLTKDEIKEQNAKLRSEARKEKKRQRERERYKRLKKQKKYEMVRSIRSSKDMKGPHEQVVISFSTDKYIREEVGILCKHLHLVNREFYTLAILKEIKHQRINLNLEEDDREDVLLELEAKNKKLERTIELMSEEYERLSREAVLHKKLYYALRKKTGIK